MKIIVFGARGDVGSRVVAEALTRGHQVTAVVRSEDQFDEPPAVATVKVADVGNADEAASLMAGQDLAITALRPPAGQEDALVPLTRSVLDAAAKSQIRIVVVGGAASLRMPGRTDDTVLTAPGFLPEEALPIARASFAQYGLCISETRANWSYLSPPAMLTPGERTGRYRLGSDVLIVDAEGRSQISMEDFAVALLDEAETPKHARTRFTVAQ